jgi:hypothetical protein
VEHLQRFSPFLEEMSQLLRPGGRLLALTPNASSVTFTKTGDGWGWACPDQHYEFVSQTVPPDFYEKFGLRVVTQRDVAPASIHYPSLWSSRVDRRERALRERPGAFTNARRFPLRAIRRALAQNQWSWGPLSFEKAWAAVFGRRPKDELLLVLEKR